MNAAEPHRPAPVAPGEDPLIPVLRAENGAPDPVALATWHQALDAATAVETPHDLFALWVFPASGGAVLLGPTALAQDHVAVPLPAPQLLQDDLYRLEQVLRRAQYPAVIAVPIRHARRDVGVMLLGSFLPGAFGPAQVRNLYRLAGSLAPALAQLADALPARAPQVALEPVMTRDALPEHLARAACDAVNGPELVRRVSGILYPLLPHDRLEILVPSAEDAFVALSGHATRRRWGVARGSSAPNAYQDIIERFGEGPTLLLEDVASLEGPGEWAVGGGGAAALPARSVLGVRLSVGGRVAGYLLLASVARDAYRPDDEDALELAGLVLAPRVAALGLRDVLPREAAADEPSAQELPLVRAAEVLARTPHLAEGLAGFAAELGQLLPHRSISLHLRRGEEEIIALDPHAPRPLADLPGMPLERFEGLELLVGERNWLVRPFDAMEEVLVPLCVAGRTVGTLGVRAESFASTRSAAAIARQFADVLAPHLELLRRGTAGMPARERSSAR